MKLATHYINGAILGAMAVALPVAAQSVIDSLPLSSELSEVARQVPALLIFAYVLTAFLKDKRDDAKANRDIHAATSKAMSDLAASLARLEREGMEARLVQQQTAMAVKDLAAVLDRWERRMPVP